MLLKFIEDIIPTILKFAEVYGLKRLLYSIKKAVWEKLT